MQPRPPDGTSRIWNHPPIVTSNPFQFVKDGLYIREAFKAMADQLSSEEWVTIFKLGTAILKVMEKLEKDNPTGMVEAFTKAWQYFRTDYVDKVTTERTGL